MSRYAEEQAAYRELDALYAELPEVDCKGYCASECSSLVPIRGLEAQRIGHKSHTGTKCAHLDGGRCSVHQNRPMLCRLWGLADQYPLMCRWGCKPTRTLTLDEAYAYLRRAQEISLRR